MNITPTRVQMANNASFIAVLWFWQCDVQVRPYLLLLNGAPAEIVNEAKKPKPWVFYTHLIQMEIDKFHLF